MEEELSEKELKRDWADVSSEVDLDIRILEPASKTAPPELVETETVDEETGKPVKKQAWVLSPHRELINQDMRKGTLDKKKDSVVYGYKCLSRFLQFQSQNSKEIDFSEVVNFFDDLANIRMNMSVSFDPNRRTPTLLGLFKTKKLEYSGLGRTSEEEEENPLEAKKKSKWRFW